MLLKRWLTAIVLIPVLLLILLKGSPLVFALLIVLVSIIGMSEYLSILSSQLNILTGYPTASARPIPLKVKAVAYTASILIIFAAYLDSPAMMLSLTALNVIAMALVVFMEFGRERPGGIPNKSGSVPNRGGSVLGAVSAEIQGILYIPLFLSFLVMIRNMENGAHWIIWLWLIIGLSDTGAYYVGTYFGKTRLSPHISPNKSLEGAMGGLGASALVGGVYSIVFIDEASFILSILFSVTAAAAGQLGDLFESALKRAGGIKDSGTILPGHGGILDRFDGLMFAAPVAYIFKVFLL
ncbi:MAG: phosphatidate cytidylyltransferase [Desulfamplus sp.]|nr:phosphatidate cytidylyltransferase [Desulfamplus sp.]